MIPVISFYIYKQNVEDPDQVVFQNLHTPYDILTKWLVYTHTHTYCVYYYHQGGIKSCRLSIIHWSTICFKQHFLLDHKVEHRNGLFIVDPLLKLLEALDSMQNSGCHGNQKKKKR